MILNEDKKYGQYIELCTIPVGGFGILWQMKRGVHIGWDSER